MASEISDPLLSLWREEELWMHGGKNQNMRPELRELRILLFHDPVGTKKSKEVEEDEP